MIVLSFDDFSLFFRFFSAEYKWIFPFSAFPQFHSIFYFIFDLSQLLVFDFFWLLLDVDEVTDLIKKKHKSTKKTFVG